MRARLRAADIGFTPERALEHLQRIQHHPVRPKGGEPVAGVSSINTAQSGVRDARGINELTAPRPLTLL